MAEALKTYFGPETVRRIAASLAAVDPSFPAAAFEDQVLDGFGGLELMPRVRRVADALHRHLPSRYPDAIATLLASLDSTLSAPDTPLAGFFHLPHTLYVASHGLDDAHFELSMQAQHALTQRSTAEYSIRAFLERHPERTLERLRRWTRDDSEHVRRLVSEGTRPRLPWAPRLRAFQRDPAPVIALLEQLKDDASEYVRRSVANNLNDIGRDHPELLLEVCRHWLVGAPPERRTLVRHALRSLLKAGDPEALALLGFGERAVLEVGEVVIEPANPRIGGVVRIAFELLNRDGPPQQVLADLRVAYVKADGSLRPRVFRLRSLSLGSGQRLTLGRTLSLHQMTTRIHYPGTHPIAVLLNGAAVPLGSFELHPPRSVET